MSKSKKEKTAHYTLTGLPQTKTDRSRLTAKTDEEIITQALSDPDAQPTDENFWKDAKVVLPPESRKEHISIRLDADVLQFFRTSAPRGYQKQINAVLRTFMNAQQTKKYPRQDSNL